MVRYLLIFVSSTCRYSEVRGRWGRVSTYNDGVHALWKRSGHVRLAKLIQAIEGEGGRTRVL